MRQIVQYDAEFRREEATSAVGSNAHPADRLRDRIYDFISGGSFGGALSVGVTQWAFTASLMSSD